MKGSWKKMVVDYDQEVEWRDLKREVLDRQIYYFETESVSPVIVDAGAHIGLATLYFKWLYPESFVWAFEPNPALFRLLQTNIEQNNLTNVTAQQAALGVSDQPAKFYIDSTPWQWWSVGSLRKNAWNGEQKTQKEIFVQSIKFSKFVEKFNVIDLLKLDIEGSEQKILFALKSQLSKIKNIIFEFHPTPEQDLLSLTKFLRRQGYQVSYKNRKNQVVRAAKFGELVLVTASRD